MDYYVCFLCTSGSVLVPELLFHIFFLHFNYAAITGPAFCTNMNTCPKFQPHLDHLTSILLTTPHQPLSHTLKVL